MTAQITAPHVYRAITAITAALSRSGGIPKLHTNLQDQYQYRSIDDVLATLAPLLAKHRLCVMPKVLRRKSSYVAGDNSSVMVSVALHVAYDLVSSRDGSTHTVKTFGEAIDPSDKATAKAQSAAYKSAILQTFCVPVASGYEADASTNKLRKPGAVEQEPPQGWVAWSGDMIEIIKGCDTQEALDRLRCRQASVLTAISRERTDLYAQIGEAFVDQSEYLAPPSSTVANRKQNRVDRRAAVVTKSDTIDA